MTFTTIQSNDLLSQTTRTPIKKPPPPPPPLEVVQLNYVDRCLFRMNNNNSLMAIKQSIKKARDNFDALDPTTKAFVIIAFIVVGVFLLYILYKMYKLDNFNRSMIGYTWIFIIIFGILVYYVF